MQSALPFEGHLNIGTNRVLSVSLEIRRCRQTIELGRERSRKDSWQVVTIA
ncbi:MAG: hypothetical protein JO028_21860 [Acidobacteriaceae bacterium]|nr:hypothetical protein [Acidobacteriaceae bacterium]